MYILVPVGGVVVPDVGPDVISAVLPAVVVVTLVINEGRYNLVFHVQLCYYFFTICMLQCFYSINVGRFQIQLSLCTIPKIYRAF